MPSSISYLINFLLLSIIAIQLTSSASFPNPPPIPRDGASHNEWAHFWISLHNYYAIIARPRFGKRSESLSIQSKPSSLLEILNPNFAHPSSSDNEINYLFSEITDNANNDEQMNGDDANAFVHLDQTRR